MTILEMQAPKTKINQGLEIMSPNVAALRGNLLNTMPSVCVERARLMTEAYKAYENDPPVLRRARALAHVLQNMTIYIQPGEIIVGNQASKPRAAPIFPEYSTDWIAPEIDDSCVHRSIYRRPAGRAAWPKIFFLIDRAHS
jgi:pyruvate-formate lyase